jgi:polyketide synthase PksN
MVVESYRKKAGVSAGIFPCYLLVISAKTKESLEEKIKDMIDFFRSEEQSVKNLYGIAHTLLERRHHFKYRCAVVVKDGEDAAYALEQALNGEKLPNTFSGTVLHEFTVQNTLRQYMQDLLKQSLSLREDAGGYREILHTVADLYCRGYEVDWSQLFEGVKPNPERLPTYPFLRECYWVNDEDIKAGSMIPEGMLHPLVQHNTSTLSVQRFSSAFTGREFFLKDHIVKGKKVLPGTAYLEMAREAVERATEGLEEGTMVCLKDITWMRPIFVEDKPVEVHIGLLPDEEGKISFEVYGQPEDDSKKPLVHSQGTAVIARRIQARFLI